MDHAAHFGGFVSGVFCGLILSQPLPIQPKRRPLRNLAVGCLGIVALTLAMLFPPKAVPLRNELQFVLQVEKEAVGMNESLISEVEQGRLSKAEFADALEEDVLPSWNEGRKRLAMLVDVPYGNKDFVLKFLKYFDLRDEAWRLQIRAIREMNLELEKELESKWEAVKAAAQEVRDGTG